MPSLPLPQTNSEETTMATTTTSDPSSKQLFSTYAQSPTSRRRAINQTTNQTKNNETSLIVPQQITASTSTTLPAKNPKLQMTKEPPLTPPKSQQQQQQQQQQQREQEVEDDEEEDGNEADVSQASPYSKSSSPSSPLSSIESSSSFQESPDGRLKITPPLRRQQQQQPSISPTKKLKSPSLLKNRTVVAVTTSHRSGGGGAAVTHHSRRRRSSSPAPFDELLPPLSQTREAQQQPPPPSTSTNTVPTAAASPLAGSHNCATPPKPVVAAAVSAGGGGDVVYSAVDSHNDAANYALLPSYMHQPYQHHHRRRRHRSSRHHHHRSPQQQQRQQYTSPRKKSSDNTTTTPSKTKRGPKKSKDDDDDNGNFYSSSSHRRRTAAGLALLQPRSMNQCQQEEQNFEISSNCCNSSNTTTASSYPMATAPPGGGGGGISTTSPAAHQGTAHLSPHPQQQQRRRRSYSHSPPQHQEQQQLHYRNTTASPRRNNLNTFHYHPHHTHPTNMSRPTPNPSSSSSNNIPPEPSLLSILHTILLILQAYLTYLSRSTYQKVKPWCKLICKLVGLVLLGAFLIFLYVIWGFYSDVSSLCAVPPEYMSGGGGVGGSGMNGNFLMPPSKPLTNRLGGESHPKRPLVEYYVHGRGSGHFARSIAIIKHLNEEGVDVRMFLTRSTLWKVVNEVNGSGGRKKNGASGRNDLGVTILHADEQNDEEDEEEPLQEHRKAKEEKEEEEKAKDVKMKKDKKKHKKKGAKQKQKGITTAISVTSLTPDLPFFSFLSHLIERITGDCEVAKQTNRYPSLIISDGDFPGMLRAKLGSIPSVGISHGQTFAITALPDWVKKSRKLKRAWEKQRALNKRAAWFSDWQIGANFVSMETVRKSAVVVRPPMRPEIVEMAEVRRKRNNGEEILSKKIMKDEEEEKDGKKKKKKEGIRDRQRHPFADVSSTTTTTDGVVARLLVGQKYFGTFQKNDDDKNKSSTFQSLSNLPEQPPPRRKIIICYFRDGIEDIVTEALIRSGFDVLLFAQGSHHRSTYIKRKNNDVIWEYTDEENGEGFHTYGMEWVVRRQKDDDRKVKDGEKGNKRMSDENDVGADSSVIRRDLSKEQDQKKVNKMQKKKSVENQQQQRLSAYTNNQTDPFFLRSTPPPRIIRVTDTSLFVPLMSVADGVVSSGGSQLLSECLYADIPQLALYKEHDDEQMLNVEMSRRLGGEATTVSGNDRLGSGSNSAKKAGNNKKEKEEEEMRVHNTHGTSVESFEGSFKFLKELGKKDESGPLGLVAARLRGSGSSNKKDKISANDGNEKASMESSSPIMIPMEPDKFLTSEEELLLLHTKDMKTAYSEFNSFVQRVRNSSVSKAYYDDLFHSMLLMMIDSNADANDDESGKKDYNADSRNRKVNESSGTLLDAKHSSQVKKERKDVDAVYSTKEISAQKQRQVKSDELDSGENNIFHGMPDAAAVISEILKEVLNGG